MLSAKVMMVGEKPASALLMGSLCGSFREESRLVHHEHSFDIIAWLVTHFSKVVACEIVVVREVLSAPASVSTLICLFRKKTGALLPD
jgi:hypothetical protein